MQPRPHQIEALNALWDALQYDKCVLLEAACSAGKTLVFSKIIQRLLKENQNFRVLVLTDREILVNQTVEKLKFAAPELTMHIGVVCASVSKNGTHRKRVTVASRQSLINRLDDFKPVQMTIIDEVHLLPLLKEEPEGQFQKILDRLWTYNKNMRLLGVTATPYRLGDGYIYGERNAPNLTPYFPTVHHKITVSELERAGYLAPLTGKTVAPENMDRDLSGIGLTAGEYNLLHLSNLMSKEVHIQSAVESWIEHAKDRKKTIAFCVTIKHAELLAQAFGAVGVPATAIHSQQNSLEAFAHMEKLKNGDGKVFCSVAKLTTGMDVEDIDCILMARPTKSPALYKQILGRGQRIYPEKKDCLVLDLVGNNKEFGTDLDNIRVTYRKEDVVNSELGIKVCPGCDAELHPAIRICPECDHVFEREIEEAKKQELQDVQYGKAPPELYVVEKIFIESHVSQKSGNELIKVRVECVDGDDYLKTVTATIWICLPDYYEGFAVKKGRDLWEKLTLQNHIPTDQRTYPQTVQEAMDNAYKIYQPQKVLLDVAGKWPNVIDVVYEHNFEQAPF